MSPTAQEPGEGVGGGRLWWWRLARALTWTVGSLLGGATGSTTIRLQIPPTSGQVGSPAQLLEVQTLAATDVSFGRTVTAMAPAVSTPS